ncbi:hypothetical protein [uncultured Methylovirgula sp.]|uniref:hypothetical protein n=1 Tax=uncultured Methylovirgula sp. TaxID=1285960 RepID=UPI00262B8E21|nr:hypothetical protein [uncultured Methylovirgula sp.]
MAKASGAMKKTNDKAIKAAAHRLAVIFVSIRSPFPASFDGAAIGMYGITALWSPRWRRIETKASLLVKSPMPVAGVEPGLVIASHYSAVSGDVPG